LLGELETIYGNFTIKKSVPSFEWGDTIAVNKRTNEEVLINDLSQIYQMEFMDLVPIEKIVEYIKNHARVEFARGPMKFYLNTSPNDPYYSSDSSYYRWSFDQINAEGAWSITTGSSSIKVAVMDVFGGVSQLHEELMGQIAVDRVGPNYGGHGITVAGAVSALTNNNKDIASLGRNLKLILNRSFTTVAGIQQAINDGADVINCSYAFGSYGSDDYKQVFGNAISQGIIVIASSGNDQSNPTVMHPAYYNFGNAGQVIAVTSTTWNNDTQVEHFIEGFNYSPGTDPINDPDRAFVDVAGPGGYVRCLSGSGSTGTVRIWAATSIATPYVSALAGLILSVNNSLTPVDVYNILTSTADKLPQYSYDSNGWNRKMGYGRINAYKALKYTLEKFGGTLTNNLVISSGETWNFSSGVTVKFTTGKSIQVDGTLNATGTTFTSSGSSWGGIQFRSGSSGILDGCTIENVYTYGGAAISMIGGGSATVKNCTIENNSSSHGISIINTESGVPYIYNNTIRNNTLSGISIYNGNTYLRYNTHI
ncbi:MAG TPA: hypothetical protein ENN33_09675, partial [Ignavibacteria bacterium]|nr:hypothetical protein [Ignavibacteria bacterium]